MRHKWYPYSGRSIVWMLWALWWICLEHNYIFTGKVATPSVQETPLIYHNGCNHLSMWLCKLNYVSKRSHCEKQSPRYNFNNDIASTNKTSWKWHQEIIQNIHVTKVQLMWSMTAFDIMGTFTALFHFWGIHQSPLNSIYKGPVIRDLHLNQLVCGYQLVCFQNQHRWWWQNRISHYKISHEYWQLRIDLRQNV